MSRSDLSEILGSSPAAQRVRLPGGMAAIGGTLAHAAMLVGFAAFGVWPMAAFNLFSVASFVAGYLLFREGRLTLAVYLVTAEVLLHQILAVSLCGWGPGFQLFLGTVPMALVVPGQRWLAATTTSVAAVTFVALAWFAPETPPYPLPHAVEQVVAVGNTVAAFAVLWMFMVLYRNEADRADRARLDALDRSETLLEAVFPAPIVQRMREDPRSVAESHPDVTVIFADLVGFTPLAAKLAPEALVALLDQLFVEYDGLVEACGCEKIKTIGDAYMAAAGVPGPKEDHVQAGAALALGMLEATARVAERAGETLQLRVGIHSGPVVAGVIGRTRFAYDLWGDTVNIAARMESHGEPGRIQLSTATAARLGPGFVLEHRGTVAIKGRHQLDTTWLVGRA